MSKRLYLVDENYITQCWWKNFRSAKAAGDYPSNREWAIHRDKVLRENHRAELKTLSGPNSCLEFETEQDAVLFLLRWS